MVKPYKAIALVLFCVFASYIKLQAQVNYTQLKIVDVKTQEPLNDGYVVYAGITFQCNEFGYVLIPFNDSINLTSCGASGYQTKDTNITQSGTMALCLISLNKSQQLQEVKISRKEKPIPITPGVIDIPIAVLNKIPAMAGEKDILKALQFTPGVQFAAEGTSNLVVRGGGVDQNLVLLDDMPMYNLNHLFGFLSVIPADAVKSAKLYKSSFPSEFGGRLSSVLEMRTIEGSLNKRRSGLSIGILSTSAYIDKPIIKDKWSFFITGRTTILDKGLAVFNQLQNKDNSQRKFGYGFDDVIAKSKFILNQRNQLSLSLYSGSDKLFNNLSAVSKSDTEDVTSNASSSLRWSNLSYSLRWLSNQKFGALNTGITSSNYNYIRSNSEIRSDNLDVSSLKNYSSEFSFISSIRTTRYYSNFSSKVYRKSKLNVGILAENKALEPGISKRIINNLSNTDSTDNTSKWSSTVFAGHMSFIHSGAKWSYDAGLRLEHYHCRNYIQTTLQPRINLSYKLAESNIIKLAYSRMVQDLHLLTNTGIGINYDIWVPATTTQPLASSHQFVIANHGKLLGHSFEVETYYKRMANLIEYKDNVSYAYSVTDWRDKVTNGNGQSYGLEIFVRKEAPRYSYWFGYTLSKTNRLFDSVNKGISFPFKYDRRHVAELFYTHDVGTSNSISATWTLSNGSRYSLPNISAPPAHTYLSVFEQANIELANFDGGRNSQQMRTFHRMDLAYDLIRQKKWGKRILHFSIINLYGRRNPFIVFAGPSENSSSVIVLKERSLFTFVPSISVEYKFE
jgi:hypothetical protein